MLPHPRVPQLALRSWHHLAPRRYPVVEWWERTHGECPATVPPNKDVQLRWTLSLHTTQRIPKKSKEYAVSLIFFRFLLPVTLGWESFEPSNIRGVPVKSHLRTMKFIHHWAAAPPGGDAGQAYHLRSVEWLQCCHHLHWKMVCPSNVAWPGRCYGKIWKVSKY